MTNEETMQWLVDHKAEYTLIKIEGIFCLKIIVKDPHGGRDHCVVLHFGALTFIQDYILPVVEALKESIDG